MIDLGPHAVFIVWAYIGVALGVALLIAWTWAGGRSVKARLADLEARGIRRRSDR